MQVPPPSSSKIFLSIQSKTPYPVSNFSNSLLPFPTSALGKQPSPLCLQEFVMIISHTWNQHNVNFTSGILENVVTHICAVACPSPSMAEWYSVVFTAHICLSIYQLKGIWAVFTFCLLWIVLWWICMYLYTSLGIFPSSSEVKASACNVGDLGLIPGSGRSPGEGNGNPFQYSCLEKSHGRRNLVGYSPRGHRESDTMERLHYQLFRYILKSGITESSGNSV